MSGIVLALALASCTASTDPWLVTNEERIRQRFDPICVQERRSRNRGRIAEGWIFIDGRTDVHLFFPWELMQSFLLETRPMRGDRVRRFFREDIENRGWNHDEFWSVLNASAREFHELWEALSEEQLRTRGNVPEDDPRIAALCRARAAALAAARAAFGRVEFDRFLYESIGRSVTLGSDPVRNDARSLLRVESGCE